MFRSIAVAVAAALLVPCLARAESLGSTVQPGVWIRPGQWLTSPKQKYFAIVQGDSNLVVYEGSSPTTSTGKVLWASNTGGRTGPASAVLQGDGNFVLYGPNNAVYWAAASNATGASVLTLDDAGALAVQSGTDAMNATRMRWSSGAKNMGNWLPRGSYLRTGDYLVSPGKKYTAILQTDGNLVIYDGYYPYTGTGAVRWHSGTYGRTGPHYVVHQNDGNFTLYSGTAPGSGTQVWTASCVGGNGQSVLLLDDIGALRALTGTDPANTTSLRWSAPSDAPSQALIAVNGQTIVALRSPSGRWLSSNPQGQLYYSTNANPSAWEEWLLTTEDYGYGLTSYFGRRLMVSWSGNQFVTAPINKAYDQGLYMTTPYIWDSSGNNVTTLFNGAKVLMSFSSGQYMVEGSTVPAQGYFTGYPSEIARSTYPAWTIVSVKSPSAGRTAPLEAASFKGIGALKSTHNTFLAPRAGQKPEAAIHLSPDGASIDVRHATGNTNFTPDSRAGQLLVWGETIDIGKWVVTSEWSTYLTLMPGTYYLNNQLGLVWHNIATSNAWKIIDPTGLSPAGSRVPLGARMCLQNVSNGMLLSANPGIRETLFSPNGCSPTSSWEHWSFVRSSR